MDIFAWSNSYKAVVGMRNFDSEDCFEYQDQQAEHLSKSLTGDKDLIMEQILENINTTPIGQVLKGIAALPEIRREKILDVRQRITEGRYDLNERLDVALDKVLEDLTV